MKKFLAICVAAVISLIIIQSEVISVAASLPLYHAPRFQSIESLVEWIETEDAENFQSGRYRDCLLTARNRGEIFFPYSSDSVVRMTQISALPHFASRGEFVHDGSMYILFGFSSPDTDEILISVNAINPSLTSIYETEGIGGFFRASRETIYGSYQISERRITIRDSHTGGLEERTVSYVLNYGIGVDTQFSAIIFVVDGVEFRQQFSNELALEFINNLTWDTASIAYVATATTPTTPPPTGGPTQPYTGADPADPVDSIADTTDPSRRTIRFTIGNTIYTINDIPHTNDVAPFIDAVYDRTMIPIRAVSEAFGADVDWDPITRTVLITTGTNVYPLAVDVPLPGGMGIPVIREDRVFVPLSFVAELLGAEPSWDSANSAVYVYQYVMPN